MRCAVTGGAGFIGSSLVDALMADRHQVTIVDDLSSGRRENIEGALMGGAELVELDIRDRDGLGSAVAKAAPEVVFHLAAQIDVRLSVADPKFDASVNVGGTISALEAARAAEVSRLVFASTGGGIYGAGGGAPLPFREDAPLEPLAPYGQSKQAGELYMSLYQRLHGLSTACLRLGNVYGPRQDPLGEAGVIAIFCGLLGRGAQPTIFGDGKQTRDYVFVDDVVDAMLAAAFSTATGAFNVGTGIETDVLTIAQTMGELTSAPFNPSFAPPRKGEIERSAIDPSRAKAELGWSAQTNLVDGLRATLDSVLDSDDAHLSR